MPTRNQAWLALSFVLACGCGGAQRGDASDAFARIQVEEARIENAYGGDPGDCDAISAACPVIQEAADAICSIAAELDDADATTRCERARARATQCTALDVSMCAAGAMK